MAKRREFSLFFFLFFLLFSSWSISGSLILIHLSYAHNHTCLSDTNSHTHTHTLTLTLSLECTHTRTHTHSPHIQYQQALFTLKGCSVPRQATHRLRRSQPPSKSEALKSVSTDFIKCWDQSNSKLRPNFCFGTFQNTFQFQFCLFSR